MNDSLPKGSEPPPDPGKPSRTRVAIWIIVGAVGLYLFGSGIWGIITGGS